MRRSRTGARRRLFAPETVQSSAMDCGPAALKCLLEGFGVEASYDRLREACQTDVDGTSIDTLEEVACQLGLDAEQVMLPPEHLLNPEAAVLPALVVVCNSIGATHFVVVWRRHGSWLQIMDPATGRRWLKVEEFLADLYLHTMPVPTEAWREWAGGEESRRGLRSRIAALGIDRGTARELVEASLDDSGYERVAALDAAVRMVTAMVHAGSLRRGRLAAKLLAAQREASLGRDVAGGSAIPDRFWSVRPLPAEPVQDSQILLTGVVLVRVRGRRAPEVDPARFEAGEIQPGADLVSPELAAVGTSKNRPLRDLWGLVGEEGWALPMMIATALVVASTCTVFEVVLFRGLLDLGRSLALAEQRLAGAGMLVLFLVLLLALEASVQSAMLGIGRRLEIGLRLKFLRKLALLSDRYFHSRLNSDMAERCHSVHKLRLGPELAGNAWRTAFQLALTAVGIAWIDPQSAPLAAVSAALAIGLPVAAQPILAERDLRVRSHGGALGRFYLDALLGLVPLRNHVAERPMRREHEALLVEWVTASTRLERSALWLEMVSTLSGYGLAAWLLVRHILIGSDVTQILLLAYWALNIPMLGQQLALIGRQLPVQRNTALRLLEPLASREETREREPGTASALDDSRAGQRGGMAIVFRDLRVVAAGHTILDGIDLEIAPGSRIAIVGPSGAGKSSLVGVLLGWHRPASGRVEVDGVPMDAAVLDALRRQTAWIDPAVQLWNRTLLANLTYGVSGGESRIGQALGAALLRPLVEALPEGLQTPLGEGGALVSGGEGQRVRLARSLLRNDARLVILDEPFRGLDRATRSELLGRARGWWASSTLLCITHDIAETADFDRVVVLDGGRVVESGEPEALAARAGSRYRALLDAESAVRKRFERQEHWRHFRLDSGQITEVPGDGGR